jgi:tol-pal system protein YbgF
MRAPTILGAGLAALLLLSVAPAALAQDEGKDPVKELAKKSDKRMDSLQKQIRDLRTIILQARDSGQAVGVRIDTDPDPAVLALTPRLDDLEQSARTINSQLETLTHDLQIARKAASDARDDAHSLQERLDKLDTRLQIVEGIQRGLSAPAPAVVAPPADTGQGPPPPAQQQAETGPPDPAQGYATGRKLFAAGDFSGAAAALQSYIEQNGDNPQAPQARYMLGESFFRQADYPDAATAYIGAVRGWPKTPWAADAVAKLARSLFGMNRAKDACSTLDELNRRYPSQSIAVAAQAKDLRVKAQCPA